MPRRTRNETWHALTADDLKTIHHVARERGPGRYTLRELYGDEWQFVRRPRRLGLLFKRAVLGAAVAGIRWVGEKSNRSQLYEVVA